SERNVGCALELQHLAGLGRRGDRVTKFREDADDLGHLVRIGLSQLALADVDAVLQPNANVSSADGSDGRQRNLMPTGGEHRPTVLLAEELVGYSLGLHEIL